MLDLVQLRSFVEVAERGTIAAAAASRGYTPPAVSQHVAKLERELGVALFERQRGRVRLSQHGRALLPVAHQLLGAERRARHAVAGPAGRPRVVVGGFASAIELVIVPRLARLRDRFVVEVLELEDEPAMRDLRLGEVDVVLTQDHGGVGSPRHPECRYVPVLEDDLRLVLPAHHPASATIEQFQGACWLINGTDTRCALATRAILEGAGLRYEVSGVVADNHALLSLVAAGHGLTIMPGLVAAARSDVTVATEELGVSRTVLAVTRADPPASVGELVHQLT